MYRHRAVRGITHCSLRSLRRHLHKIGVILYIKGYRYKGKYGLDEAVLVRGTKGSIRFGGFLWSYFGEGPRGTNFLLKEIGVSSEIADQIAFHTPRLSTIGEDWRITPDTRWTISVADPLKATG